MVISDSQIPTQHNIKAHFSHDKANTSSSYIISNYYDINEIFPVYSRHQTIHMQYSSPHQINLCG